LFRKQKKKIHDKKKQIMVKKKSRFAYWFWSILVIVVLALVLLALLITFLVKKYTSDKYYFTFQKGDVWEDATFELVPNGKTSGYVTTFTQQEKDMYTEKFKVWKQKFPSVKNGNLVYFYGANGNTKLYVDQHGLNILSLNCSYDDKPPYQCARALIPSKKVPSVSETNLYNGYFHICDDPSSFEKIQSVAQNSWGLSSEYRQSILSPGYKCPLSDCIEASTSCTCTEAWDSTASVFTVLAGSKCISLGFNGFWPCDFLQVDDSIAQTPACKPFTPSSPDDYKLDLSGTKKSFDARLFDLNVETQFVLTGYAVNQDDQGDLDELITFLKRIQKSVVFFHVHFEIHTPTVLFQYVASQDEFRVVKEDERSKEPFAQSFYLRPAP
jgi:hypothetical protein